MEEWAKKFKTKDGKEVTLSVSYVDDKNNSDKDLLIKVKQPSSEVQICFDNVDSILDLSKFLSDQVFKPKKTE